MKRKGFDSVKDFQGMLETREKLSIDINQLTPAELPQKLGGGLPSQMVSINDKKCIKCGWCVEACTMLAIRFTDTAVAIDQGQCEVCGMCVAICPMKAPTIAPRE